jgi:hypothetical protein
MYLLALTTIIGLLLGYYFFNAVIISGIIGLTVGWSILFLYHSGAFTESVTSRSMDDFDFE